MSKVVAIMSMSLDGYIGLSLLAALCFGSLEAASAQLSWYGVQVESLGFALCEPRHFVVSMIG